MIKVSKLNKYFNKGKPNEIHVINDTSIEFGKTGLVCILGESGSGKTTFINTLGGLDTFQSGNITIDDKTISKYSPKYMEQLRNSKFAFIFQEQYLLQDYAVAYNIRLALNSFDISEEEREARIDYVLQAVEMKKYKKRLVSQLSGGQKQRIAIARALVKSPEVIFADEPTGNLDEANTMRIMSIIKKISKDCLVILVTHERRIAEFFADRIIHIQDGKITLDIRHKGINTFQYSDDTNLYLKEYEKEAFHNGTININLYRDEAASEQSGGQSSENPEAAVQDTSTQAKPEISVNLVYSNGKLYIQAMDDSKVVLLNSGTEMQMVDDVKPVLELEQLDDFDYSLEKVECRKEASLSMKELYKLAKSNIEMLGKKQIFMIVTFIITALLLVFAVADYMTAASVDKASFITDDSHYLFINAKRNSSASNTQYYNSFNDIYYKFLDKNIANDIYIDLNSKLYFNYNSFGQISRISNTLPEAAYVTLDHLKQENLILGWMPQQRDEIVVDQWLLQLFLKNDVLKNLMTMEDFIGLEVQSDVYGEALKIVGICDTQEPTIYIDKYVGISMASWADKVASLQQLQTKYPGQYDSVSLAAGEALINESEYADMLSKGEKVFTAKNGVQYKVAGTYTDDYGISYVIDDAYYKDLLNSYICTNRKFKIYGAEKEAAANYFSLDAGNYDSNYVLMMVNDTYKKQMGDFEAERAVKLNARFIGTVTIFIISLFMLYFTMKSNAMKRAQELMVYRLLGITKRSILSAFILEVIMITSYTVLPVVLILSSIIKFVAVIPSLQMYVIYPWMAVAALLVFLYAVNIVVGIIPVYNIVKLPPAQLAEKV
ncbi:MAG TPA: ABC transporter ATP-binding protein/permease [Mobilitalea sp.]|nr:ABC transporter ATP-binding protein/permease [Mobilitalea sp.]